MKRFNRIKEASTSNNDYCEYLDELQSTIDKDMDNNCIWNGDIYVTLEKVKTKNSSPKTLYNVYVSRVCSDKIYIGTYSVWFDIAQAVSLFVIGCNAFVPFNGFEFNDCED